jgi:hypothetical protein
MEIMPKNIILILSDDNACAVAARNYAAQLGNLGNTEIRPFSPTCLNGLKPEDVNKLVIIGHADQRIYGSFSAEKFVEAFNNVVDNAEPKLSRSDIRKLNCIGCELGFIDENKQSLAQTLVNEFAINQYDLKLAACTNVGSSQTLGNMFVSVSEDAVNIVGFCKPKDADLFNNNTLRALALQEEMLVLKKQQSRLDRLNPWSESARAIDKHYKEQHKLMAQAGELQNFVERIPAAALDHDEKYQFSPKWTARTVSELDARIKKYTEDINYLEARIRGRTYSGQDLEDKQAWVDQLKKEKNRASLTLETAEKQIEKDIKQLEKEIESLHQEMHSPGANLAVISQKIADRMNTLRELYPTQDSTDDLTFEQSCDTAQPSPTKAAAAPPPAFHAHKDSSKDRKPDNTDAATVAFDQAREAAKDDKAASNSSSHEPTAGQSAHGTS